MCVCVCVCGKESIGVKFNLQSFLLSTILLFFTSLRI